MYTPHFDPCGTALFVAFEGGEEHLMHLFAEFEGFEHLDAVAVFLQLIQEVDCGADVEGEVCVMLRGGDLALGMVQGQRAQVVGRPVVGADDDVGQRRIVRHHAEVL